MGIIRTVTSIDERSDIMQIRVEWKDKEGLSQIAHVFREPEEYPALYNILKEAGRKVREDHDERKEPLYG